MDFRHRLLATLEAAAPLLQEPGVLVIGSEVPNLLQPEVAATLVVSQDIDLGIPVARHAAVKARLREVKGLHPSPEEPSVWIPDSPELIEVNLVGRDPTLRDPGELYVLEDSELPIMVFGALSLLTPGAPVQLPGLCVPVPRLAGLLVEKLLSVRGGNKGERDLLVSLGLLLLAEDEDLVEIDEIYSRLSGELRYTVRSNLSLLSLLEPLAGMPDPRPHRRQLASLLVRLERLPEDGP